MGMALPVGNHNILAAFPFKQKNAHLLICHRGMAHIALAGGGAMVIGNNRVIIHIVVTDEVDAISFRLARKHSSRL